MTRVRKFFNKNKVEVLSSKESTSPKELVKKPENKIPVSTEDKKGRESNKS
jgi:hypothetical protein